MPSRASKTVSVNRSLLLAERVSRETSGRDGRARQWNQEEMAEYLDVSPDTYGAAEAGRPILRAIAAKIAHKLELDPSSFFIESAGDARSIPLPSPGADAGVSQVPVIAVMAFTDLSADHSHAYFCEGLSEEITHLLSQVPYLNVLGRASVFGFHNEASAAEIGHKLGASHILRGGVRRGNRTIRITVQFVSAATGLNLWSQRFDRDLADVLAIQEEIAASIVQLLADELHSEKLRLPRFAHTSNMKAYNCYLQGLYEFHKQTPDALAKAIEFYKYAVDEDSNYAPSYVGLADCYTTLEWYGVSQATEVIPLATVYAERALKLQDSIASGHCVLAVIKARYDWDWKQAESHFKRTFALNPGLARAHFSYALDFLTPLGRLDEALQSIRQATLLDPLSPILHTAVGGCYYRQRNYPDALTSLTQALELNPHFYHAHWSLARTLEQLRLFDRAISEYKTAIQANPNNPMILAELCHCYAVMGKRDLAEDISTKLQQISTDRYVSPLCLFFVDLGMSLYPGALEALEMAIQQRIGMLTSLPCDPRIDRLRSNSGFREVLGRIGAGTR